MRKIIALASIALLITFAFVYTGCRRDVPVIDNKAANYPDAVGNIILTKCAVSGCHNAQSKDAAAGLDLTTWNTMMDGDRNGAVCIPYAADFSTMFLFTNTYSDFGAMVTPTMPNGSDPLTRDQVRTIRDWINAGAPNAQGFVKWSDDPFRKKYYVTIQGCDKVCSIDEATGLQMRYIPVGATSTVESPHAVRISPDGQYWYCCFSNSAMYLEKHRTSDDAFVGRILLGPTDSAAIGFWNTFAITPDSHYAYVVDWEANGRIARVDLQTMQWLQTYQGSQLFVYPHGSMVSADGNTLYLIPTQGNFIYKVDISLPQFPSVDQIIINGDAFVNTQAHTEDPHEMIFSPDGTKYFVTCSWSNCVRVMDAATDQLLATIPIGVYPQEISLSPDPNTPYAYVTCMEDNVTYGPSNRGSVFIFNWQTNAVVGSVNTGWQPHGIAVDDDKKQVFVANRNVAPGGPAPHHSTSCVGRNGYFTLIDMNTQHLITGSKTELIVDPYGAVYRR
jgi:YVTN family beta-propeller protein